VRYLVRPDNSHAKAGNINHALRQTEGELVFMLDADHVPMPDALDVLVGYFDDERLALVQTPHDFYNQDSVQHYDVGRHEQSVFYEVICPGKDRHGAKGKDIVLRVPVGTQIFEDDNETLIADFTAIGQTMVLLSGGNGGFGNAHFKTSANQAPRHANPGLPGEERTIRLRLKLIADAGIVGLPNAGKSTFLAAVSAAKPKIADYPFTTLHPQLGVVRIDEREFVLADLPGLIEDAHEGVGLGDRFLGHVERCRVLLHLVDGTGEHAGKDYKTVRHELTAYGHGLADKPEIVALSKADALTPEQLKEQLARLKRAAKKTPLVLSSAARRGVPEVLRALVQVIDGEREPADMVAAEGWHP